ncbi:sugar kinase [Psychromonas sp. SA13A]|uniref:sugar kinase n=1 Tax=Psychromonas sp. SA13A TaxID=2686346 RepID=UPI001408A0D7|nr:sugar kinase [Psychromonas sp. SA13A]
MKKIAIIGECMIELNGKPFGPMQQTFGGDTLNAAVYLSRSSNDEIKIQYVTAMGTDPLSDGMIQRWQDEGVGTKLVLRDASRSPGLYLIQVDDQGERTFLYWRNQSAAKYLFQHKELSKVRKALLDMDMVFLSGISFAILEQEDRELFISLLKGLADNGIEIVFDSNYRPALWANDSLKAVREVYKKVSEICSIALVTFEDEQLIWGDRSYQETLTRYQQSGTKKVVIRLGAEGCVFKDFENMHDTTMVKTTPVQTVVDTTSAGDSFNGGFLSAYLTGETIENACIKGNLIAGIVIQHQGAIIAKEATNTLFN